MQSLSAEFARRCVANGLVAVAVAVHAHDPVFLYDAVRNSGTRPSTT
jgi:hypothetical protein